LLFYEGSIIKVRVEKMRVINSTFVKRFAKSFYKKSSISLRRSVQTTTLDKGE